MTLGSLYNTTVNTQRPGQSRGTYGELVDDFDGTFLANVSARVQHKTGREMMFSDKNTLFSDYTMYVDPDTDIGIQDRVVMGTQTFEVKAVDPNHDNKDVYMKVELLEIK